MFLIYPEVVGNTLSGQFSHKFFIWVKYDKQLQ